MPVEWLREYVKFHLPTEELAERLTMAGLEVEEIREVEGEEVFSTYVTPNRSDLLSVLGVARETAALLGIPYSRPEIQLPESSEENAVSVEVQSPENCPRYSARLLRRVTVKPSPEWMQKRLTASGMRPINNVVDATNYVLLEMGQPLHAFDYDLLAEHRIIVRQARDGETMKTIDGEERELDSSMLVIADAERAVAVAGVMGGFDSEVGPSTKNILLESAHFNRLSIRRTARKLSMSTESSHRFERWVDPNQTTCALDRVAQLIIETGGGEVCRGTVDVYPTKIGPACVEIRPERASKILGFPVTEEQVTDYLTRLGMQTAPAERMSVLVPTFRPDIGREEDLIEEVGRVYGYERIPERLPVGETRQGQESDEGALAHRVTELLISAGLQEVCTSSMVPPAEGGEQIKIRNPISDDVSRLRASLIVDLLGIISYNSSRGIRDIGIFEVGRIFEPQDDSMVVEKLSAAGAITGSLWDETWNVNRGSLSADFFLAKGIVENVLERLGVRDAIFKPVQADLLHPTRAAVIEAGGERLGVIGQISLQTAERWDVPQQTYVFELELAQLMELSGHAISYKPLSRYPTSTRDLAVVVSDDVPYRRVKELIFRAGGEYLESVSFFDLYTGTPLQPGQKSLAFSLIFRSGERTLRDEEVDEQLSAIRSLLSAELQASFRDT
ncbi:MAG: phenylalanine--tRNA ligase subunit beta [Armatimonadota bacterium]